MRVRAERPPWYLSVVGGALYVSTRVLPVVWVSKGFMLWKAFSDTIIYIIHFYFPLFHLRKHLLAVQQWFQIMLVILKRGKSLPRYFATKHPVLDT